MDLRSKIITIAATKSCKLIILFFSFVDGTIAVAEATVDDTGKGTYTFDLPDGYGAKITATFTECATFTPTISITGWTYGSAANDPVVTGNTSSGAETITYSIKDANSYSATVPTAANNYTVKVSIAAKGHYKAAEATANFNITAKAITNVSIADISDPSHPQGLRL